MPDRNWCFFGPTYPSPMSRGSYVPGHTSSSQRSTALSLPSPGETDLAHLDALAACRRRDGHPSSCLFPEAPTCCGQAMWRLGADSCRVTAALCTGDRNCLLSSGAPSLQPRRRCRDWRMGDSEPPLVGHPHAARCRPSLPSWHWKRSVQRSLPTGICDLKGDV